MRTLKPGSKGEAVRELQTLLGNLLIDGDFGELTEAAVKEFQIDHDLKDDGIVGKKTWAALKAVIEPTPTPPPIPPQKPPQSHKGAFAVLGLVVAFALSWLFWGP